MELITAQSRDSGYCPAFLSDGKQSIQFEVIGDRLLVHVSSYVSNHSELYLLLCMPELYISTPT